MQKGLFRFLNVEKDEQSRVGLLLLQSLFLGFFYGTLDIGAHALFLSEFSEHMLPHAFVISGLVGILLTTIYSHLQSRFSFSGLSLGNLVFVLVCMILLWLGFNWADHRTWVFVLFVMMGPLNIVAMIGFGGTTSRLFTLREGKRVFGLVDAGQILGIIISSYAIPFILSLNVPTTDLILFSAISILLAFLTQVFIVRIFDLKVKQMPVAKEKPARKTRFTDLFKDRYTFMMSSFVGFSVIVAFLIHYTFIAVTNAQYPENRELAKFLGYFMGTLTVFTLLFKTLVYGRLTKTYGLKVTLLISPVLITILTIAAALIGSLMGYTTASASFTFFFLIIALTKLFSKALKDSIEVPSFKVLYLSLDERIRYDVQARVDGTVNEVSAVLSGLVMSGLAALSFIRLIHFNYVLLVFVVIWIFVGFRLYTFYQKSLSDALTGLKKTVSDDYTGMGTLKQNILSACLNVKPDLFTRFFSSTIPFTEEDSGKWLAESLQHCDSQHQILLLEFIRNENRIDLLPHLQEWLKHHDPDHTVRSLADEVIRNVQKNSRKYTALNPDECLRNPDITEKRTAFRYIAENDQNFSSLHIQTALRDTDHRILREAISLAGRVKDTDVIPVLVDHLNKPETFIYAFNALINIGTDGLEHLERAFYKTELEVAVQRRIIRAVGKIGGEQAEQYLLNKTGNHLRPVVLEVIRALKQCGYQPDSEARSHFFNLIEDSVRIFAWNLAAESSIHGENVTPGFEKAIRDELNSSLNFIYELLSITYDPQTINHIRQNLEHGSAEAVNFALELLDLVIDEEIKPFLFPALNDISPDDKIRELQNFFPVNKTDVETLILNVLNRDANFISAMTKTYALLNLIDHKPRKVYDDIIAQMFHPDPVLSELAGRLIYEMDRDKFEGCFSRLNQEQKDHFRYLIQPDEVVPGPRPVDRIHLLQNVPVFKDMSGRSIYTLSSFIRFDGINVPRNGESLFPDFYWQPDAALKNELHCSDQCILPGMNILETLFDEPEDFSIFISGLNQMPDYAVEPADELQT
ncbi:MAG: hypothetical protein GXO83_07615 [Chlorobi bacterium]|nr:hypothetical protein [Chlorobiota bacterium]